jgi:hypothetical protein
MRIVYLHASKFGNGAMVAAEFAELMAAKGVAVEIHHIRSGKRGPTALAPGPKVGGRSTNDEAIDSGLRRLRCLHAGSDVGGRRGRP